VVFRVFRGIVRPLAMGGSVFGGISDVDRKGLGDSKSDLL